MTDSTIQGLIFILTPCLILWLFGKPLYNTDNDADEYEPYQPPRKYHKHYTISKR